MRNPRAHYAGANDGRVRDLRELSLRCAFLVFLGQEKIPNQVLGRFRFPKINDRLQLEMEKIKELPYDQVALTSAPANSSNASDPRSRVATTTFNVNRSGSPNYAQMVYNGGPSQETTANVTGGAVDPGPTPFQSGNVKGTVYRFVTWAQDSSCGNCSDRWYKHVTVAVALDSTAPGGTRLYQEVQGDLSNPNAGIGPDKGGPGTGAGGNDETPWTFWLTDTACSANGRQVVAGPDGVQPHILGMPCHRGKIRDVRAVAGQEHG